MNKAIPIVLVGGLGAVGIVLLTRRAKAAPEEIPSADIPTREDIMQAQSIPELSAYYNLIGGLLIIGKITPNEYMDLYDAYRERWYQLVGGS